MFAACHTEFHIKCYLEGWMKLVLFQTGCVDKIHLYDEESDQMPCVFEKLMRCVIQMYQDHGHLKWTVTVECEMCYTHE